MISKFLKQKTAKSLLDNYLAVEILSEIFKVDKDKILDLLIDYINK